MYHSLRLFNDFRFCRKTTRGTKGNCCIEINSINLENYAATDAGHIRIVDLYATTASSGDLRCCRG